MIAIYAIGLATYIFQLDMAAEETGEAVLHYVLPGSLGLVNVYSGEVSLTTLEIRAAPKSECWLCDVERDEYTKGKNAGEFTIEYVKLAAWAYLGLCTV